MLYQLLNKLSGWDYIYWHNCITHGIARVHSAKCGRVYYWRYKSISVLDVIKNPNEVIWLTCPPSKYFKNTEAIK